MNYRKLWTSLIVVMAASFAVLIYYGNDLYHKMPPIPARVVSADGAVVFTGAEIRDGQNVWQSAGGQQMGSVWGHGAYVAPDWSADWLHRESVWLLDLWARQPSGKPFAELAAPEQAYLRAKLQGELRTNTYRPETGELIVSADRAAAIRAVAEHYRRLFSPDPELAGLREAYAIPGNVLRDDGRRHQLTAFFFWAAWACAADRPGERTLTATAAVLFSTTIFLAGGILGTFHHLYFSGTPTAVMALGAVFSALEVVPLVLIGFEAYENLTLSRVRRWVAAYRWPIYCFVAVAFWNLVGAGLFGFLINPPIALYYMQGLNTTAVHGHTALFGVYGMLGIGLMLFCLKGLTVRRTWRTGALSFAFWSINIGLALMVLLSDLPRGLMQTVASVNEGMWWARSAEFMQQGILETFRWLRVVGDTIFGIGVVVLGWFVLGIRTGWSLTDKPDEVAEEFAEAVAAESARS